MESGSDTNPALNALLDDYVRYHVVLAVVGGLFLLGLVVLSVVFWWRFVRAPRVGGRKWTFEKKTYFGFGIVAVLVGMFLALVLAANVSTVISPRQGFSGSIGLLRTTTAGTPADELYRSVDAWLQSGTAETPAVVQATVDDRLAWQRPKAIVCTVLLVVFVLVTALVWRSLIRMSRMAGAKWTLKRSALLLVGFGSVLVCLVLMLMVMGNIQGWLAPISLTLFFA